MMTVADIIAGCDISKDKIDVCVLLGERTEKFCIVYDEAGLAQLLEGLQEGGVQLCAFEASGGYERKLMEALCAAEQCYASRP
jgi:transposase